MDINQSARRLNNVYIDDQNVGKIGVLTFVALGCMAALFFSIIGCIFVRKRIIKKYWIKKKLLANPNVFPSQDNNFAFDMNHQFYLANNSYPNSNNPSNYFQHEPIPPPSVHFTQNICPSYPLPPSPNNTNNYPFPPYYPPPPFSSYPPPPYPPPTFYSPSPPSSYPQFPPPSTSLQDISASSRKRLIWLGQCMVFYLATCMISMISKVKII